MAGEDDRDRLHRGDREKVENAEELEAEEEDFSDLIGQPVENDRVASTAEAVRAQRQEQEEETSEEIEDLFLERESHEFIDDRLRAPAPVHRTLSTADEDDEGDATNDGNQAPAVDPDEDLGRAVVGQSWLSSVAPPPPPTETAVAPGKNSWTDD